MAKIKPGEAPWESRTSLETEPHRSACQATFLVTSHYFPQLLRALDFVRNTDSTGVRSKKCLESSISLKSGLLRLQKAQHRWD